MSENTTISFFRDLKRFDGKRALIRDEHRERLRDFRLRQYQLAGTGAVQILFLLISGHRFFACLAVVFFVTATRECWRMRTVGRYWQTKRSMEVMGI